MGGSKELGFLKTSACSLREQLVRRTLQLVRSQGHTYVELREEGKRVVFFCMLCRSPCYCENVLFDHLNGSFHSRRYVAAKATLLKPNPWPLNDGVFFFHDSSDHGYIVAKHGENEDPISVNSTGKSLVPVGSENAGRKRNLCFVRTTEDCEIQRCDGNLNGNGGDCFLVIPGVINKSEISDLEVRFIGIGKIVASCYENGEDLNVFRKIWCEWLGKEYSGGAADGIPENDFAVVTLAYDTDLGREALFGDLGSSCVGFVTKEIANTQTKKRKSLSDPEDISESLSNRCDSSVEESLSSGSSHSRILSDGCDDDLWRMNVNFSKSMRRKLRRKQHGTSERMCDICQHKMLPGKDVAALLNMKTGRLVCSSRNMTGAFHVFHVSCLLHWIILCESEMAINEPVFHKGKRRCRRKTDGKNQNRTKIKAATNQIYSVLCPECQGTGIDIDGNELERPTVNLSEMFKYKVKTNDAHKAWMRHPEMLENCSTGLHFESENDKSMQETRSPMKLLRFYRAGV